jgi:hypothetical protein
MKGKEVLNRFLHVYVIIMFAFGTNVLTYFTMFMPLDWTCYIILMFFVSKWKQPTKDVINGVWYLNWDGGMLIVFGLILTFGTNLEVRMLVPWPC